MIAPSAQGVTRLKLLLHAVAALLLFTAVPPPISQPPPPFLSLPPAPRPQLRPNTCVARQLSRFAAGDAHAAARAPPHPTLRPLAFAIPVHPPAFPYLLDLLWARRMHPEEGWDVYLILSSRADAAALRAFLAGPAGSAPLNASSLLYPPPLCLPRPPPGGRTSTPPLCSAMVGGLASPPLL